MSNAPTKTPVKKLGATMQAACDLTHPGCTADPVGIVQAYREADTKQQVNACKDCHDSMVLAGQWVDTP